MAPSTKKTTTKRTNASVTPKKAAPKRAATTAKKPTPQTTKPSGRIFFALVILAAFAFGVYASMPVFFPPSPPDGQPNPATTSGTLEYAIHRIGSGDTAYNTQKLGGKDASSFLKVTPPCPSGQVWKGINADGEALCGATATPLVMEIRLLEGQIKHNDTVQSAPYTFTTSSNDTIETTTVRATLQFTGDKSIVRLDTNTRIKMEAGILQGNTVAQTILER